MFPFSNSGGAEAAPNALEDFLALVQSASFAQWTLITSTIGLAILCFIMACAL